MIHIFPSWKSDIGTLVVHATINSASFYSAGSSSKTGSPNNNLTIIISGLTKRSKFTSCLKEITSRERHISAPCQMPKISKRTSNCQVFFFTVPGKPRSWTELASLGPLARTPGSLKKWIFKDFCTFHKGSNKLKGIL